MDQRLTSDIQQWLASDDKDVAKGADMLLSLNRNRFLHRKILSQPEKMLPKLEYELKKHLQIRLDGLTLREVEVMQSQLLPSVRRTLSTSAPVLSSDDDVPAAEYVGIRSDHDQLPRDVQALPERNRGIFFKIKQLYNTLLSMFKAPACDRYEHLKILKELDTEYHQNWERYDHAVPVGEEAQMPSPRETESARKFVTRNLSRLEELMQTDESAAFELRGKMLQRIVVVERSDIRFSPDIRERLERLGMLSFS